MPTKPFHRSVGISVAMPPRFAPEPETSNDEWRRLNWEAGKPEPPDLPDSPEGVYPMQAEAISPLMAELLTATTFRTNRNRVLDSVDEQKGIPTASFSLRGLQQAAGKK